MRLLQFLDKFPNLEDFSMEGLQFCHDSDTKLRIMLAVSNFTKLKTLTLPALDENDEETFKYFLKWAPETIQTLNLKFQFKDLDLAPIKFLHKILKSLKSFKNLLSLGLELHGWNFKLDKWTMKKIKPGITKLANSNALLIDIVDCLDEIGEQMDWVKHIRISCGHMFIFRLLDKHFKNVERLEVNKSFNEPCLLEDYPVTTNLQSIKHLNVHGYENDPTVGRMMNEIIGFLTLFPNLQELIIPYIFLFSGHLQEVPEARFLKKLIVSKSLISPPNILLKMPNLAQVIIRGKENGSDLNAIRMKQYLPKDCEVTFEPVQENKTLEDLESILLQHDVFIGI